MRVIRITTATLTIFTTAIFSHLFAGGFIQKSESLIFHLFITTIVIQFLLSNNPFEGPNLALAILISHGSFHFVIGGGSESSIQMTISHLAMGIACYHLFKKIDTIILYLENQIQHILFDFKLPKLKTLNLIINYFREVTFTQNLISFLKFQRAPPFSI